MAFECELHEHDDGADGVVGDDCRESEESAKHDDKPSERAFPPRFSLGKAAQRLRKHVAV